MKDIVENPSYNDKEKYFEGSKTISFNKFHILMNISKYNLFYINKIKRNHVVHIFVDQFMDPFYGDDNLFDFCLEAYKKSKKDIIFHIWKKDKSIKYSLESKLYGFNEYKIQIESKPVSFKIHQLQNIVFGLLVGTDIKQKTFSFVTIINDTFYGPRKSEEKKE